jgi:hypothetical protein
MEPGHGVIFPGVVWWGDTEGTTRPFGDRRSVGVRCQRRATADTPRHAPEIRENGAASFPSAFFAPFPRSSDVESFPGRVATAVSGVTAAEQGGLPGEDATSEEHRVTTTCRGGRWCGDSDDARALRRRELRKCVGGISRTPPPAEIGWRAPSPDTGADGALQSSRLRPEVSAT